MKPEKFIRLGEIAVLVIDMQNDFIHEKGKITAMAKAEMPKSIIPKLRNLLNFARSHKIPVIYIKTTYRGDRIDAFPAPHGGTPIEALIEGSWGAEIVDELKPTSIDYIVVKRRFGSFYGTDLEILLKRMGTKTLIVTGVGTNVCVESTIREAKDRDYNVIALEDCTASGTREAHERSLKNIQFFGIVTNSEKVIEIIKQQTKIL
jgi:ureidoacrylate peracid hydrolase